MGLPIIELPHTDTAQSISILHRAGVPQIQRTANRLDRWRRGVRLYDASADSDVFMHTSCACSKRAALAARHVRI